MKMLRCMALALLAFAAGCGGGGGDSFRPPIPPLPEAESNDFTAQAVGTLSTADIVVAGSTSSARDVDLFRVTAAATVNLLVRLDWSGTADLELTISNAAGIFVREVDTLGHPETCTLAGLPAGDYTIRVGSFDDVATGYTLTLGRR